MRIDHRLSAIAWTSWGCLLIVAAVSGSAARVNVQRRQPNHPQTFFKTSDNCLACHNGLTLSTGEDVSIGSSWRATIMANSARDPYWQASVRRETLDHPKAAHEIEDECAVCHMPMARTDAVLNGRQGRVFDHLPVTDHDSEAARLAADGVSCTICHQITASRLGTRESFTGGYVVNPALPIGERPVFGPFAIDKGHARIMHSSTEFIPTESVHVRQSELCATCHTLYTKARDPNGALIGELPEQVPFLEWRHSAFGTERSCQSCHMPTVAEKTRIASVLGDERDGLARHTFLGGNFFLLRMLNRFRVELGVEALPAELESASRATERFLGAESATVSIDRVRSEAGRAVIDVSVRNLTGHKLPTAYPSRRAWLHVVVRDAAGRSIFESGRMTPAGLIDGNDNDADATKSEPHYREIRRPDEVQIYESILVDASGSVTTGLLRATRYLKDNRLLPRGFEKRTAERDIAVVGSAAEDDDFTAEGDRIRYIVETAPGGAVHVDVELCYQPIGFRWAQNLKPYDASEPRRFVTYYEAMSPASMHVLARAAAVSE